MKFVNCCLIEKLIKFLIKVEVGETVKWKVRYYSKDVFLDCEIISSDICKTVEGVVDADVEEIIDERKRILSTAELTQTKKKVKTSILDTNEIDEAQVYEDNDDDNNTVNYDDALMSSLPNTSANLNGSSNSNGSPGSIASANSSTSIKKRDSSLSAIKKKKIIATNIFDDYQDEELTELSIADIMKLSYDGNFPKKMFIFGKLRKLYTSRLLFWTSIRKFPERPKQAILFNCKICNLSRNEIIPNFTNLNHHMKEHETYLQWLKNLRNKKGGAQIKLIDDFTLKIVRFIVSSNTALLQLHNPSFVDLFTGKEKVPTYKIFRNKCLPDVMSKLSSTINSKLDHAEAVCLVVDLWSSPINKSFLALAAVINSFNYEKELCVLGMKATPNESHSSEVIKKLVEDIVNDHKFDKSKIVGRNFFFFFLYSSK